MTSVRPLHHLDHLSGRHPDPHHDGSLDRMTGGDDPQGNLLLDHPVRSGDFLIEGNAVGSVAHGIDAGHSGYPQHLRWHGLHNLYVFGRGRIPGHCNRPLAPLQTSYPLVTKDKQSQARVQSHNGCEYPALRNQLQPSSSYIPWVVCFFIHIRAYPEGGADCRTSRRASSILSRTVTGVAWPVICPRPAAFCPLRRPRQSGASHSSSCGGVETNVTATRLIGKGGHIASRLAAKLPCCEGSRGRSSARPARSNSTNLPPPLLTSRGGHLRRAGPFWVARPAGAFLFQG